MIYLTYAIMYTVGIAATVYLAMNEHPWFAFFVLLVTASLRMRHGDSTIDQDG